MPYARFLLTTALAAFFAFTTAPAPAQEAEAVEAASPKAAAKVPDSVIKELTAKFRLPGRPRTREELAGMRAKVGKAVIAFGKQIEGKYAGAENLHEVRGRMLYAADFVARAEPSAETRDQKLDIARSLVEDNNAPAETKVTADYFLTLEKVAPKGKPADGAKKHIEAYLQRYAGTDAVGLSLIRGSQLAAQANLQQYEDQLLDKAQKDHASNPQIAAYLKSKGRSPFMGKPFEADLPVIDGTTLSMPADTKGKVVVVDFWAMWCGPCIRYLPHIKRAYQKYKDNDDVLFVGISLDEAGQKSRLADFVKKQGMSWVHTYTGKKWQDPTVRKYGVNGIPAIWVIGKDGMVFSTTARTNLEGAIDKALAQKAAAEE